jgi:hypothetical protein
MRQPGGPLLWSAPAHAVDGHLRRPPCKPKHCTVCPALPRTTGPVKPPSDGMRTLPVGRAFAAPARRLPLPASSPLSTHSACPSQWKPACKCHACMSEHASYSPAWPADHGRVCMGDFSNLPAGWWHCRRGPPHPRQPPRRPRPRTLCAPPPDCSAPTSSRPRCCPCMHARRRALPDKLFSKQLFLVPPCQGVGLRFHLLFSFWPLHAYCRMNCADADVGMQRICGWLHGLWGWVVHAAQLQRTSSVKTARAPARLAWQGGGAHCRGRLVGVRCVRPKGSRSSQRTMPPSSATQAPAGARSQCRPIFQRVCRPASISGADVSLRATARPGHSQVSSGHSPRASAISHSCALQPPQHHACGGHMRHWPHCAPFACRLCDNQNTACGRAKQGRGAWGGSRLVSQTRSLSE